jgi:hypothetical protein
MEKENKEQLTQEAFAEEEQFPEEELQGYTPRPVWQVVLAWVCLVLFVGLIAMYLVNIARGGL